MFNTRVKIVNKYWKVKNTVTINKDYTLKLITNYTDRYYFVSDCYKTFTNNGNVIIDNYSALGLRNNISNNGTMDINNGGLGLYGNATLNNTGTITFKGSSSIYIASNATLTNTSTGTIDISNITDLSGCGNKGTFTLKGGSTFILPKSISIPNSNNFKITLNGTDNKPVNIVIPKSCKYIKYIYNNNNDVLLFNLIKIATGLIFNGERENVNFSWQTSVDNEYESVEEG